MKLSLFSFFKFFAILSVLFGCSQKQKTMNENLSKADSVEQPVLSFQNDVDFLKKYTDVIILQDASGNGKVAVSAALQGRVMTSTSEGDDGLSYGWINKQAFLSGDTSEHFNAYGGEDRIWLGPEGGQFSIYFSKGKEFKLDNWYVPRLIDLEPYKIESSSQDEAVFTKQAQLTNYSGTTFDIGLTRRVNVIEQTEALKRLGLDSVEGISMVAFETMNELKNVGTK